MAKITANGIEIEYSITGAGEPLVLIAGLAYTQWCWHRVVPLLAKYFSVITFDNRGVGGSSQPPGPYTAELLADDTASLISGLGIKKANIAGISMGGFVTQALAIRRPDLFSRMILMSTGFGGARQVLPDRKYIETLTDPKRNVRERMLLACAPGFAEREKEFFEYWYSVRARESASPSAYQSQLAVGLRLMEPENSFERGLSRLNIPTLILHGEKDQLIPVENARLLRKCISGSHAVVFEEIGHFLPFENPRGVVEEMATFIFDTPILPLETQDPIPAVMLRSP